MASKKKVLIAIGVLFIVIIMYLVYNSKESEITIQKYHADITLDDTGTMHVTETWDMVYDGDYNVRFRDIDYVKYPDSYPLYKSTTNRASFVNENTSFKAFKNGADVTQSIRKGYSFELDKDERGDYVSCEPIRQNCESVFTNFKPIGGLDGNITFIYYYSIEGAVTEYSDISELNWTLFQYAESKIDEGTVTIHLPSNAHSTSLFDIYSHQIENTETEIKSNDTITMSFTDMRKKDVLALRLLMPPSIFTSLPEENKVIHPSINQSVIHEFEVELETKMETGRMLEETFIYIPLLVAVFMFVCAYFFNATLFGPKRVFVDEPAYRAPTNHSPAQVSFLINKKKFKDTVITATLLDLVRREYLDIDDDNYDFEDQNITFKKSDTFDNSTLTAHEVYLVDWVFGMNHGSNEISTKMIENYATNTNNPSKFIRMYQEFKNKVHQASINEGFIDPYLKTKKIAASVLNIIPFSVFIVGILLGLTYDVNMFVAGVISPLTILLYSLFIWTRITYSVHGQELLIKWKRYKQYLENKNNYGTSKLTDIEYWDEALVFATVFNIADVVMEQLTLKEPPAKSTKSNRLYFPMTGFYTRHSIMMQGSINNTFVRSVSKSRRKIASARAARSSSSSGGFSGGSFGGGGGGGRSR